MPKKKTRHLGVIEYPNATIEQYDARKGIATIAVEGSGKLIKIKLSRYCIGELRRLANKMLAEQRSFIKREQRVLEAMQERANTDNYEGKP